MYEVVHVSSILRSRLEADYTTTRRLETCQKESSAGRVMWYGRQQKLTSLVDFQSNELKLFHFSLGMGPLQVTATWYKILHAGEQATHRGHPRQRKFKFDWIKSLCLMDVPVCNLLSTRADFVQCDR